MGHYKEAYKHFKKVHHLMGMYMSKARETELIVNDKADPDVVDLI